MTTPFAQYVARPESEIQLTEAALLIAAEVYPWLDVAHYVRWLDKQGEQACARVIQTQPLTQQIAALNQFVFDELGFRGNQAHYDDPRNSYLNEVIERRTGIPLTLSLVYMEIGVRAGLHISGVGLPGHFIVRVGDEPIHELRDPFNYGARLTTLDCEALMRRVYGRPMALLPQYLAPVSKKEFLLRMLNNLENVYLQSEQWALAKRIIQNKFPLYPNARAAAQAWRALGLAHYKLNQFSAAEDDWLRYLVLQPDAYDADVIRENIEQMRQAVSRRN
jgi:regulator of sirC expression with transglutaminase-like and TPR domain